MIINLSDYSLYHVLLLFQGSLSVVLSLHPHIVKKDAEKAEDIKHLGKLVDDLIKNI